MDNILPKTPPLEIVNVPPVISPTVIFESLAVNGKVEIRPVMYLALSYDHRIIDGRESVGFLVAIKEALENPSEILMGNNILKSLEL